MKISVATTFMDNAPSYHLRFKSIFELLRTEHKIVYQEIIKTIFGKFRRFSFNTDSDLILIVRIMDTAYLKKIFDHAAKFNIPVLYETDDLILYNRRSSEKITNFREVSRYMNIAHGIITSTSHLADELRQHNNKTFIFQNLIDTGIWDINEKKHGDSSQINICCIGTGIMPENFKFIVPAVEHCLKIYGRDVIFHLWGNEKYIKDNVRRLKNVKIIRKRLPYLKYARSLQGSNFDIAVVPLTDSRFNRAKSNIKYLEYGISMIPALFSKVTPYGLLPDGKSCILVENNHDDWLTKITGLIENRESRINLSREAYSDIMNNYLLTKTSAMEYFSSLKTMTL
jgi:hypothetical protein